MSASAANAVKKRANTPTRRMKSAVLLHPSGNFLGDSGRARHDAGLVELRAMMADRRLADPVKFAHIRRELGIYPQPAIQKAARRRRRQRLSRVRIAGQVLSWKPSATVG
jgi:hypothetical protein